MKNQSMTAVDVTSNDVAQKGNLWVPPLLASCKIIIMATKESALYGFLFSFPGNLSSNRKKIITLKIA